MIHAHDGESIERALTVAREAVALAEVGCTQHVELSAPAGPVLAELLDEGALERAIFLLERGGDHSRIAVAPRQGVGAPTVSEVLEEDHRRLDALAHVICSLATTDPARAVATARLFACGLRRHFRIEEEVLFPLFEERTGLPNSGPTARMRIEHEAMAVYLRRLVESADRVLTAPDRSSAVDELLRAVRGLSAVLGDHNAREERALFPVLDRTGNDRERRALLRAIILF